MIGTALHFPYAPRSFQLEAAEGLAAACEAGGHVAFEAPTGFGKTAVLVAASLATSQNRRVLYVTRTNTQQAQALAELTRWRVGAPGPLRVATLQGRHRLCLKLDEARDAEMETSTPEDLSHYCSAAKRATEKDASAVNGCTYYAGLLERDADAIWSDLGAEPRTAEAFKRIGEERGYCSYEASKRIMAGANFIVAPYPFAFDPSLRRHLLEWWQVEASDVILLVDEAHNVPDYVRSLHSPRLTHAQLQRALSESDQLGHPMVAPTASTRAVLQKLETTMDRVVADFVNDDDGFIPPFEVEGQLLEAFQTTSNGLLAMATHFQRLGEIVRDRRRKQGRIPRSSLQGVGRFLEHWIQADEEAYVKLATRLPRPGLETFCVDPRSAAAFLHEFHATVHASGTMAPLSEYRDTLGLGAAARLERYPSPFDPARLRIAVARDLSTKYERMQKEPDLVDRLQDAVKRFIHTCTVSAAIFFPSHQLLHDFSEVGAFEDSRHRLRVETRELTQDGVVRLIQQHRDAPGQSILVGVLGGRLSEGLDFPGRQLDAILVVGAPYPKPTARQRSLFRFHEATSGKGWEYAVRAPAARRLRQAAGRLIRGQRDRGFAIILDDRASALLNDEGMHVQRDDFDTILESFAAWQASGDDTVK